MDNTKIGILILLLSTTAPVYATTVSIADTTVEPGGVVTIPIMVNGITDYGSGTVHIEYDPSVVHVIDVTSSPDSQVGACNPNNTIGHVQITAANVYGANGDIAFANVEFTAVGTGSTPLNLDVVSLYNRSFNKISATPNDGTITISAKGGTPTPTSDDGSSGGSTIGTVSTSTPTSTPTLESTSAETPHPAPAPESVPHDEATDTSTHTPSTVKPTPSSQMSTPGFEIASLIIGFLVASLILRRNNE